MELWFSVVGSYLLLMLDNLYVFLLSLFKDSQHFFFCMFPTTFEIASSRFNCSCTVLRRCRLHWFCTASLAKSYDFSVLFDFHWKCIVRLTFLFTWITETKLSHNLNHKIRSETQIYRGHHVYFTYSPRKIVEWCESAERERTERDRYWHCGRENCLDGKTKINISTHIHWHLDAIPVTRQYET